MADKVSTKLTTVHNWVELVYKAFGQTLPTGAKELALLGVREASLTNKGAKLDAPVNKSANEGDAATADYSKVSRVAKQSENARHWDDLLFAAWTDSEKEDSQGSMSINAPSIPKNTRRTRTQLRTCSKERFITDIQAATHRNILAW